jgi:protocatechuate 3,4-dioxygenase beta subunit
MRHWMLAVFLVTAGLSTAGNACVKRVATPETDPGPHDFSHGSHDPKLWREGDAGEPLAFKGRVMDICGKPVVGARVLIVHANQDGDHEHDRWRADLKTDRRGTLRLLTVFPGYTGSIPRHIHFIITHPLHRQLVTRLFFKNDPSVDHGIEDLAMVLEEIQRPTGKGWAAGYEFVLQPK